MNYSETGGLLLVQVMDRLLHVVQCNWQCIDGSSDVQNICMQHSATGVDLVVQVMYKLLNAIQCN